MGAIRVLLVDDHPAIRAGLRLLLRQAVGIEIVAEAADGRAALRAIAEHQPQVVLLDISMPGATGLEVVAQVRRDWPEVRVLILSVHKEEELIVQALRAGAAGYLLKDAGPDELEKAIRRVAEGETYVAPNLSQHVVRYLHRTDRLADTLQQLTPRQREVLQLIAEGRSTKEIAADLGLSIKTIEAHRAQVMDRLGIHDVPGLVRFAIRAGLISPER
jgi:RNA polymerase sigma factor (sigma-70 family)